MGPIPLDQSKIGLVPLHKARMGLRPLDKTKKGWIQSIRGHKNGSTSSLRYFLIEYLRLWKNLIKVFFLVAG
jgi:hypothetical protein